MNTKVTEGSITRTIREIRGFRRQKETSMLFTRMTCGQLSETWDKFDKTQVSSVDKSARLKT
jgi:hypothetical protein